MKAYQFSKKNTDKSNAKSLTSFFDPATIQPKLTMGQPGDKYEKEADVMADRVVTQWSGGHSSIEMDNSRPSPASMIQPKCNVCAAKEKLQRKPKEEEELSVMGKSVQRKCADCAAGEEKNGLVQTKSTDSSPVVSAGLQSQLNASKGSGSPLPDNTRSTMESAFGVDFSGVRVHIGSQAIQMSRGINAHAFTHGTDIYFNNGEYNLDSQKGKRLLAHELTHVVQQNRSDTQNFEKPNVQLLQKPEKVDPPADLDSDCIASPEPFKGTFPVKFDISSSKLDISILKSTSQLAKFWNGQVFRLDGYASADGNPFFNWYLSCNRVLAVKDALMFPQESDLDGIPDSSLIAVAHGETNEFSKTDYEPNRTVTLTPISGPNIDPGQPDQEPKHGTGFWDDFFPQIFDGCSLILVSRLSINALCDNVGFPGIPLVGPGICAGLLATPSGNLSKKMRSFKEECCEIQSGSSAEEVKKLLEECVIRETKIIFDRSKVEITEQDIRKELDAWLKRLANK